MKEEIHSLSEATKKRHVHIQETINTAIITWNLQGDLPPHNSLKLLFTQINEGQKYGRPDMIVIGTQQCERSLGMSFFCEGKQQWEQMLREISHGYQSIVTETLRGLHIIILVRKHLEKCITVEQKEVLRAGTCNIMGNKGAVSIAVNLLGQNFQFINCHLAPHQTGNQDRNSVLMRIIDNMVDKDHRTEVFIFGDLNYRIDITKEQYARNLKQNGVETKQSSEIQQIEEQTMGNHKLKKSNDAKINTEEVMKYSKMIDMDQLNRQQILKDRFLPFYNEGQITFPPTYKLGKDSGEYNHTRIPGWTDRIFCRKGRSRLQRYLCLYNLYGSDHRPVIARYQIDTEEGLSIFPDEYVQVSKDSNCQLI